MSAWRYVQHGQAQGPVDAATLQNLLDSGAIDGDTLVWKEGMANWVPIRTLPDFKIPVGGEGAAPQAPPVPGASSVGGPPPIPGSPVSETADVEKNKIFAVLAYVGILFVVPLLAAPNSKFARYHANQGIVLFLAGVILTAASMIMAFVPLIGCMAGVASILIAVAWVVLMVLGITNAASGQTKPLPLIGHYQVLDIKD